MAEAATSMDPDPSLLVTAEALVMTLACMNGLVANVMAIVAAAFSPHLRHIRVYIINRAVADLLFLLPVPLDVVSHLQDSWVFSPVLCKMRCALMFTSLLASSSLLVGVCLEIYVSLARPRASRKFHSALAKIVCVLTWSAFLVLLLPILILSEVMKEVSRERYHCVSLPLSLGTLAGHILRFLAIAIAFLVPLLACWLLVHFTAAYKNQHVVGVPDSPAKTSGLWHPRKFLVCLVSVFTACHLPYWLPQLLKESLQEGAVSEKVMTVFPATMCLPSVCAAVSPVICLMFNKALKKRMVSDRAEAVAREQPAIPLQPL